MVEFQKDPEGVWIPQWNDTYSVIPIEYKKGSAEIETKKTANELQLCAEAMCLEEMLMCKIKVGYMYYGETRHRTEVVFSDELRNSVSSAVKEMWAYWSRGYTPKVKPHRGCKSCSLVEICLAESTCSVKDYISRSLD